MDWKYLYTSREGRINRKPYWLASLVLVAVSIAIQLLLMPVLGLTTTMILTLPILFASFALNIKRGHDRNRPDWYVALYFVILILVNIAQLMAADPLNPSGVSQAGVIILGIWSIVLLIDLGFLKGTSGPNKYGPDPLA